MTRSELRRTAGVIAAAAIGSAFAVAFAALAGMLFVNDAWPDEAPVLRLEAQA